MVKQRSAFYSGSREGKPVKTQDSTKAGLRILRKFEIIYFSGLTWGPLERTMSYPVKNIFS